MVDFIVHPSKEPENAPKAEHDVELAEQKEMLLAMNVQIQELPKKLKEGGKGWAEPPPSMRP